MSASDSGRDRPEDLQGSTHESQKHGDEENPFIAFRRYADEQIASLLHSMIGIPSGYYQPSSRDWLVFSDDEEYGKSVKNWGARPGEDYYVRPGYHQGGSDGRDGASLWSQQAGDSGRDIERSASYENGSRNHRYGGHAVPGSVFDSAFDGTLPFGPLFLFRELAHLHAPFIFDFLSPSTSAGWPTAYLLFSPYSPLHLERQQQMRNRHHDYSLGSLFSSLVPPHDTERRKEPCWRDAFEDLLRIENGQEMLERDCTALNKKEESGKEWLAGMIARGSLGESWTHVNRPNGEKGDYFRCKRGPRHEAVPANENDAQRSPEPDESLTELDLYDAFLHQVNNEAEAVQASPLLKIILEEKRKHRRDLEELQRQWREMQVERPSDNGRQALPDTELDHYEQQQQLSQTETKANVGEPSELPAASRVLSTVTSTERRTQPDGSIRTKTIVNTRFADGREERFETDETNHHTGSSSDDRSKGGWFWKD